MYIVWKITSNALTGNCQRLINYRFNEENINISKLFSEDGIKLLNERKKLLGDMDRNVLDSLNTYFKSLYSKHLEKLSSDLRKEEQERLKKIKVWIPISNCKLPSGNWVNSSFNLRGKWSGTTSKCR